MHGHPDPSEETFCAALSRRYEEGAREAGHIVETFRAGAIDFPILRRKEAFYEEDVPPALAACQEAIRACDHLVVVFPIWDGTLPALLKGMIEQVWRPGFAMTDTGGFPKPLLKGKSGRIVCTMGMPALAYRILFRAHGVRNLQRNILGFSGVKPVRTSLVGTVESEKAQHRERWLERVRALGAAAR